MSCKVTRKSTALLSSACALLLPFAASAVDFSAEFHGYTRLGAAHTTESGSQQCFQLPGAAAKYRFGNECEQLAELDVRKNFIEFSDGSFLRAEAMAILINPYGEKNTFRISDDNGGSTRLAQAYVSWDNISWLNGGAIWGGRRYYKRNNVDINDFFYWNNTGTGVGIEEVGIGSTPLKLSYFFSRRDDANQTDRIGVGYVNRHDLQLGGIPTNRNGALQLGVNYLEKASYPGSESGWQVTAQHRQREILGGNNVFAVQYGKGSGIGLGSTAGYAISRDISRFRVVEALDWQFGQFSGQVAAVFQRDRAPGEDNVDWVSVGVRPVYALSQKVKLILDVGHDRADASTGTANLTKATLGAAWSPSGPSWNQRPEFRVYYTHANWNRAAQIEADRVVATDGTNTPVRALSSTGAFGNDRHGGNFGVQIEHWW